MQPQPGSQLAGGRYILESRITRSGMGEVWLAKQQGGGVSKTVVVKMIHPDLNAHREAQQRFFDEAQIVARINHPHVVKFYEFGEQETALYQVMEYIEGYAFSQIVEHASQCGEKVPIPVICRLLADACQGLGFIHDMKDDHGRSLELVHRDISPQNLLVSNTGTLKIIDFGIVKAKKKTSRTRTGVIVGKLQYMSPEQLSSEDLDYRSDIYSLGLVLYEMLTLESRFRGSNLLEIFYEAFNEPLPKIIDLRPDCPPELVSCVHKALAQTKESRFANAYEMQDVLESILHARGTPHTHRQISTFMEELFAGENVKEETTRIHAASLMSEFQQAQDQLDNQTINAASIDDLGDLDNDLLSGTMISPQTGRSNVRSGYTGNHTMSAGLPAGQPPTVESSLPMIQPQRQNHTLQGPGMGHTPEKTQNSHWGVPTQQQSMATMSPPTQSSYLAPATPIPPGQVSEETVMLSAASVMNEMEQGFMTDETVLPTMMHPSARARPNLARDPVPAQVPIAPPPTVNQPPVKTKTTPQKKAAVANRPSVQNKAKRKRKKKNPKNTIWLGLSLGFGAFLLGILLVYFFMGN